MTLSHWWVLHVFLVNCWDSTHTAITFPEFHLLNTYFTELFLHSTILGVVWTWMNWGMVSTWSSQSKGGYIIIHLTCATKELIKMLKWRKSRAAGQWMARGSLKKWHLSWDDHEKEVTCEESGTGVLAEEGHVHISWDKAGTWKPKESMASDRERGWEWVVEIGKE